MGMYYSATLKGFLKKGIHTLPADAVPVTAKRHAQLMDAQTAGGEIVADEGGKPIIRRPADNPTSPEETA